MKKRRKEPETLREHCRHIFGDEPPVLCVWETEFDYADAELKALAAKEWQQISERDLSAYYVLNLVYNEPMQIELFRYLFPLWQEMMNASQRQQVRQFLLDTALQRMDNERGFNNVLCWLAVFNTLGGAAPLIRSLWSRWWALDTPGKAVCAIQYAAHLIYPIEANPLWSQEWIGWGHPLGHKDGWSSDNRAFLRQMLTPEMIVAGVQAAAEILRGEPEGAMAARIAQDAYEAMDILTIQIEDLLRDLSCDESGHALE